MSFSNLKPLFKRQSYSKNITYTILSTTYHYMSLQQLLKIIVDSRKK